MKDLARIGTLMPGAGFITSLTDRNGILVRYGSKEADAVVVQFADDDEETQLHSDVLVLPN